MSPWAVVVAGGVIAGYGALSRRLSTTVISAALVFVVIGLAIGPLGLDLMSREQDPDVTRTLLESALALVLFTDAAAIRVENLRRERFLPVRLLVVGLPATMALGWLVAWPLMPGLGVWELALIAVVLAPTDAALGQQAVADERVPGVVRHGLSVESGLNDGLALPFFVLVLAAVGEGHGHPGIAETFFRALLLSGAIGIAAGWAGASMLRRSQARGWSSASWSQLMTLAVPVVSYALCLTADGSGFIGAWAAGLAFGSRLRAAPLRKPPRVHTGQPAQSTEFAEHLGLLLGSLSFLAFGAVILGPTLQQLTWQMVTYGLISLTAIRMLPVAGALAGTGLRPASIAYIGWFGPRGLASLVFGLIAFEEHLPGGTLVSGVVAVTVALSILLHGATAPFLGSRYGEWFTSMVRVEPGIRENLNVDGDGDTGGTRSGRFSP